MIARPSITSNIPIILNDTSCKYTEINISTDTSKKLDIGSECFFKRSVASLPGQQNLKEILIELPNISQNLHKEDNINAKHEPEIVIKPATHNNDSVFAFGSTTGMSSRRNSEVGSNNELLIELPNCISKEMRNLSQCNLNTNVSEIVIDLPVCAYSKVSVLEVTESHVKCDLFDEVLLGTNKCSTSTNTTGKNISTIPEVLIEFPMVTSTSRSKAEILSHLEDDCKEILIEVPFNKKSLMTLEDSFSDIENIWKIVIDHIHRNDIENSPVEQDLLTCPTCFGTWSILSDFEKHLQACYVKIYVQSEDHSLSEIDSLPFVSQDSKDANVDDFAMLYTNIFNPDGFRKFLSKKLPASCYRYKEGNVQSKVKQNKSFPCKFCSTILDSNRELVQHVTKDHKQYKHQCLHCPKLFYCSTHLNSHMRVHVPVPEQCPLCDKVYATVANLDNHIVRVHGPGPSKSLECDICGRCFCTKKDLTVHVRAHKKKCFKCEYCGKIYQGLSALKGHLMNVHTGEKPFQCLTCAKKFTTKSYLKLHEGLHGIAKSFLCHICGQSFALEKLLLKHDKTHNIKKIFVNCQICGKRLLKECMPAHLRTHTGEKPFTCKVCGHSCVQRQSMKIHVQAKHKGVNVNEVIQKCY